MLIKFRHDRSNATVWINPLEVWSVYIPDGGTFVTIQSVGGKTQTVNDPVEEVIEKISAALKDVHYD